MSYCCCGDKESKKKTARNGPPKDQSMNDRGGELDDDERAVDWWRSRQKDEDEDENGMPGRDRSIDNSMNRMQERNPLEKPYGINSRELPLTPQNGNVLNPPKIAHTKETTPSSTATSNSIEVFEPEISSPRVDLPVKDEEPLERITLIAPSEKEPMHRQTDAPEPVKPADQSRNRNKKDSPASFVQVGRLKRHKTNQGVPRQTTDDFEDHLSDVPSDVDSVTKERYLLACHMLKTTLIEKEKGLIPIEREFIMSLLEDFEKDADAGSAVSEDQVFAIERATLRLDMDPLFQHIVVRDSDPVRQPSPLTTASIQMHDSSAYVEKEEKETLYISKNPHTSTKKPKKSFLSMPCNPRTAEEAGVAAAADIVLYIPEEEDEDPSEMDEGQLVRFDGWNFHKSAEYPFRILGADGQKMGPRVLTPSVMEALRGFFPYNVSESNLWLKFSLARDGASLATLLSTVRASSYTIIGVETMHGEVFGSFTGAPWRTGTKWFGSGEAFLWRLKKSRLTSPKNSKQSNFENEMEVYPYTGYDDLVQYCTTKTIAVGGGDWLDNPCPFQNEPRGIGFMIDGDLAGGETNSCATFANPRLCKKTSASNEFSISNLEVWTLTPCLTVKDASKLELQKLFVEENLR